jgi:hypothetical protein
MEPDLLTPGKEGGQKGVTFFRDQDEVDPLGRFFKRLEKRVGRLGGHPVGFRKDVNLLPSLKGLEEDISLQIPDLIDPDFSVLGTDNPDVRVIAPLYFLAGEAQVARVTSRLL